MRIGFSGTAVRLGVQAVVAGAVQDFEANQPCSFAMRTMSTRERRPSFSIERALYVSTVFTLTWSWAAISLLVYPLAMSLSTTISRSLNFSTAAWVNFKLFGFTGLMFAFIIAQSAFLSKYLKDSR